jgi:hypothetical protein
MAMTYTCKNSDGLDVPSYFFGRCDRNLGGQVAAWRWSASAAQPTPANGTPAWTRAPVGSRCYRSKILIEVATLDVLPALTHPL